MSDAVEKYIEKVLVRTIAFAIALVLVHFGHYEYVVAWLLTLISLRLSDGK